MESRFDISAGELKFNFELNHVEEETENEVPKLTLAPFTNNTKLCFENVTVGSTNVQQLIVENPSSHNMKVTLKNLPPPERHLRFSWEMKMLPAHDTVLLEIEWNPDVVDTWRHTIVFQFGRSLKKDLPISFKSIRNKKLGNSKQAPSMKSPQRKPVGVETQAKSRSKVNGNQLNKLSNRNKAIFKNEKENINPFDELTDEVFWSPNNKSFTITTIKYRDRRATYSVKGPINKNTNNHESISEDSLEMPLDYDTSNKDHLNLDTFRLKANSIFLSPDIHMKNNTTKSPCRSNTNSSSSPCDRALANISTETYVKGNFSSDTYTKANLSSDTYVKDGSPLCGSSPIYSKKSVWFTEISPSKQRNLSPILDETSDLHRINMSGVGVRKIIEANLWGSTDVAEHYYIKSPVKCLKRKSDFCFEISPAKRAYLDNQKNINQDSQHLNWNKSKRINVPRHEGAYFDPYMVKAVYQNEEWMEKQEILFKKWLNALLTPPVELDANVDGQQINVAKLWQECKQRRVLAAPSKENISIQYHTNQRLDSLRKSAYQLFRSQDVAQVLSKTLLMIENQKLSIRQDKNVHLDLGLQSEVMSLFLSYNPLWLRIGLETLYNTSIMLSSNSDIMGLSSFIMQNFFKDSFLLQRFKSIHSPKYTIAIKKFVLKKFLSLVYFLDVAKTKILIPHDPCLFRKNAIIKESKEIILGFSRELLSSVGDVTKMLRFSGYVLNHKQKYINEFDYSVNHLGVDLRDGVRLTRVMEIILMKTGFTDQLRVPAVSRLQKIHNMKIVFDALTNADFQILGDIIPKDIVDGHHEKTLSFLWQIIYKFQAPLMVNAANKILKWWRSLRIVIKRRLIKKRKQLRCISATKIQVWYRRQKLYVKLMQIIPIIQEILQQRFLNNCATQIQSYIRMYIERKQFLEVKQSVVAVQRFMRGYLLRRKVKEKIYSVLILQSYVRMWIKRKQFLYLRASAICIQHIYRAKKWMVQDRNSFLEIKAAVITVQRQFRSRKLMKIEREKFITMKIAVITLQQHFRAYLLMKTEKYEYETLRCAVITIQKHFKAYQAMRAARDQYLKIKFAAFVIQTKFRAHCLMKAEYSAFNKLKQATKFVQSKFRANRAMRLQRLKYQSLKRAVLVIQTRFRANQAMKKQYITFNLWVKAAVTIQTRFRANKEMKAQRYLYQSFTRAVTTVQQRFKANRLMQCERQKYQKIKSATIIIQQHYRAYKLMKAENAQYNLLRDSCICVQRHFRAKKLREAEITKYQTLRHASIVLQRRYRAHLSMIYERRRFNELKKATIFIQSQFRANLLMKKDHEAYVTRKSAVIAIQRRFRANKLMKTQKNGYTTLKMSTIKIQQWYKATTIMYIQKQYYLKLKNAVITLQRQFRSNKQTKLCRKTFLNLKTAAITIQIQFRATQTMKIHQTNYQMIRNAAICIQRRYRANCLMKTEKQKYDNYKKHVIALQRRFRANKLMKIHLLQFTNLKNATTYLQNRFRANKAMSTERRRYVSLKRAALVCQKAFRAKKSMQIERQAYQEYRNAVITIQTHFKALYLMKTDRKVFLSIKSAAVTIQTRYRATLLMKSEVLCFKNKRTAAVIIQKAFRAYHLMKIERIKYRTLKIATITIQSRFRATKAMQLERRTYRQLTKYTMLIQNKFRANKLMIQERVKYTTLRNITIRVQQRFRANQLMKCNRNRYLKIRTAAIFIQRKFQAKRLMRVAHMEYINLRRATICIQRQFRATIVMKTERDRLNNLRKAAIVCQKLYRSKLTMKIESNKFQLLKKAAITVQQRYRANKAMQIERSRYTNYKSAVVFVQRHFRAKRKTKIERSNFKEIQEAATKIQRIFRKNKASRLERTRFLKVKNAAVIIQRRWRLYLQIHGESFKMRREQQRAAIKIQAFWRGHSVRKNHPEVANIRKNVEEITTNALPENTLHERRQRAIQILTDNPTLLQVLRALEDLDFITRRCKKTLVYLSDELPELLYVTITSANRSPAEMDAATIAASILINICKYHETMNTAWVPTYIADVIKVMSHCCDKEDKLFSFLCTLIWLFAHNENHKQYIRSLPVFIPMFRKIRCLCLRKQKMVSLKTYATFSYFRTPGKVYKPLLVPDWGFDYIDRPRTFTNSVHALNSVLKILDFIE